MQAFRASEPPPGLKSDLHDTNLSTLSTLSTQTPEGPKIAGIC